MGVPAFFRWLAEKYPKIVQEVLERRMAVVNGVPIPLDLTEPNPNSVEFDNLYVDMNGLIHPCSHPEDREAPSTEFEMYVNVTKYVDRLFAAVRPRRLLYLAIDGVAPRAKMNQQRSRRFRAAQDAKERAQMMQEVLEEMKTLGIEGPERTAHEWDSNVITPGTEFMARLSAYLKFYVLDRMNRDPAWARIKVIISDASVPGEGEHKIMAFIRAQRSRAGYDPNQRHILHGLDADLIMLALATHEAHFTILREEVTFGRNKSSQKSDAQKMLDEMTNREGAAISAVCPEDEWVYAKTLQRLNVGVLREYLAVEFGSLSREGVLPFAYDLERIIDDFVFMCFFVGNDFLPHLPSLDIRDGAIDFLIEAYKELLPTMGNYITSPGGIVNLPQVNIIMKRVGEVEDQVFQRRKAMEDAEKERRARQSMRNKAGGRERFEGNKLLNDMQNKTVSATSTFANRDLDKIKLVPLGEAHNPRDFIVPSTPPPPPPPTAVAGVGVVVCSQHTASANANAAQALRNRLSVPVNPAHNTGTIPDSVENVTVIETVSEAVTIPSDKKRKLEEEHELESTANTDSKFLRVERESSGVEAIEVVETIEATAMEEEEQEEEAEADFGDEEEVDVPPPIAVKIIDPALKRMYGSGSAKDVKEAVASKLKFKQTQTVEKLKETVTDNIRLHEAGWKDRYYGDPFKKKDLEAGGGLAAMCQNYVKGLCWVFHYYYDGCVSWSWYYPFHYAPFASDVTNIDTYVIEFEKSVPFHPFEQLLAVLPAESAHCLPEACSWLMTQGDSPIIDIYNSDIPIDPNGKPLPWLWVLLIDFIDESRVREAMRACEPNLTEEEARRNSWGEPVIFVSDSSEVGMFLLSEMDYKAQSSDTTIVDVSNVDEKSSHPHGETLKITFHCDVGQGIQGELSCPPAFWYAPLRAKIPAPAVPRDAFRDIPENHVVCVTYICPDPLSHESKLLPGVVFDAPTLTEQDMVPRRAAQLHRGRMDILHVGRSVGREHRYRNEYGQEYRSESQRTVTYEVNNSNRGYSDSQRSYNNDRRDFGRSDGHSRDSRSDYGRLDRNDQWRGSYGDGNRGDNGRRQYSYDNRQTGNRADYSRESYQGYSHSGYQRGGGGSSFQASQSFTQTYPVGYPQGRTQSSSDYRATPPPRDFSGGIKDVAAQIGSRGGVVPFGEGAYSSNPVHSYPASNYTSGGYNQRPSYGANSYPSSSYTDLNARSRADGYVRSDITFAGGDMRGVGPGFPHQHQPPGPGGAPRQHFSFSNPSSSYKPPGAVGGFSQPPQFGSRPTPQGPFAPSAPSAQSRDPRLRR
jgi:5'-3' exoribonuclease 2